MPRQGYQLGMYGASIFENWRGTAVGVTWAGSGTIVQTYNETFPPRWSTHIFAISGAPALAARHPLPLPLFPRVKSGQLTRSLTSHDCCGSKKAS